MASFTAQTAMETQRPTTVAVEAETVSDAELIETHMRRVFRVIYRVVGNVPDAQDLTQDAFVKALKRRDQLKDPEKAAHWLGRIATNTALDFIRRKKRVAFDDLENAPEIPDEPSESPEQLALRGEKRKYIEDGLRLLSERERAALVLRDIEGLPAAEVARHIGCSPATVRSHIANARVKFRRYVEGRKR